MQNRGYYWLLVVLALGCERGSLSERLHREAEVATREGRLDEAAATLERALRFDPADRVALERLVVLKLRRGDVNGAFFLTHAGASIRVGSVSLRNAGVTAAVRSGQLPLALEDARELEQSGKLAPDVERELLDALVAEVGGSTPLLGSYERLPARWLATSFERILEAGELERSAVILLARPVLEQSSPAGRALKQQLLARAFHQDFALSQQALQRLTRSPETALEYLGRLEYALRAGDEAEAARLEPAPNVLVPPYAVAWRLRLARRAARRGDWYGVLERTQGAAHDDTLDEARRRVLRCWAQLKLGERRAARAELADWLAQPAAAQTWSASLHLPELANAANELTELRREVLKAQLSARR
jgi:tetratricopeptide (TPR) repeat protein